MSSLSPKDRVSLCSFTFSDGRRCRSPRAAKHPRFCFYHAQKEARARAAETLGKDLAYFFSGDYLSACDLSTALGRLIPAVVRGDVKPKTAHTVAYLMQTLLQAIHLSQHEYINAFGTDAWRDSVRNSVNANHDYLFPHAAKPNQPPDQVPHVVAGLQTGAGRAPQPAPRQTQAETQVSCHSGRSEEPAAASSNSSLATHHSPLPQSSSPRTPMPRTSSEFVQHVVAGLQTGQKSSPLAPQPSTTPPQASSPANPPAAPKPQPTSQPAETPVNCHSERSEESASSSNSSLATHHSPLPQTPAPSTPQSGPNRDAPWLHWGDTSHIRPDSHLL
jgi:hypothetical protein